jgi:ubiquinone/menaquinone biosynthesis C-methylase UbiE
MHAFGALSALFREADRPAATAPEVAWFCERIPPEGLTLDVMCGWGRVLVPLAAQGRKVHGVDASAAMLARCDARLAAAGASAPTFRQDVAELNLPFRYSQAFIADGAFQLLTDPNAAAAALERIRAHLVAPGLLFVDCRIPPAAVQRLGAPLVEVRTVKLGDGTQIALRAETAWTAEAQIARAANRYVHRRGAQRLAEEHEKITSTWYAPEECAALLRAAGFNEVTTGPGADPACEGEAFSLVARL